MSGPDEIRDEGDGAFHMTIVPLLCANCGDPILNVGDPPVWTHVQEGNANIERGVYCDGAPALDINCDDDPDNADVATPPRIEGAQS